MVPLFYHFYVNLNLLAGVMLVVSRGPDQKNDNFHVGTRNDTSDTGDILMTFLMITLQCRR